MRLAIVAPEVFPLPPIKGGAVEALIEALAQRLEAQGHQVHLLGIADGLLPAHEMIGQRLYHRWRPNAIDRLLLASWRLPFKRSGSKWYYRPYSRWAAVRLRALQPQVVQVVSRLPFVPWARAAAPRATLIWSVHQASSLAARGGWSQEAVRACDIVTGCSRFMVEEIVKRYPAAKDKARVLPNGLTVEQVRPWWEQPRQREQARRELRLGDGPVVLYAGRLVEQKGVHVLIEAFARVAAQRPDAQLVIAGGHTYSDARRTPYMESLQRVVGEKIATSPIRWLGYVPAERMAELYLAADVVAVPSIGPESFSMTALEAMAHGVPVLSFDHGGPRELIEPGRSGWLVSPVGDAQALAAAFEAALAQMANPAQRDAMGRAAREVAQRYDWPSVAERFVAMCQESKTGR